ncbi:hypothetical protein [Desulfobacter latus]|uniref:hypothetical protein n=1 Tax=Desulfobacter latus TaxID=2292 RepID=UPI001FE6C731|nr:hypothetical protein [Desulfobacter latus]
MSEKKKQTFDSPWKQVIETFFPQFMSFFVPGSENDIDWSREIKFLDKELQKITKASVAGQKYADKLIEVTLKKTNFLITGDSGPGFRDKITLSP